MQIIIETKFDIGEVVYIADFYEEFIPRRKPVLVRNFDIRFYGNQTFVTYLVIEDGITERVSEGWMFSTYEECVEWCEKKNNGDRG